MKSERRLPIVSDVLANYKVGNKNADLWLTRDSRAMCQTIITRNKSDNGLKELNVKCKKVGKGDFKGAVSDLSLFVKNKDFA